MVYLCCDPLSNLRADGASKSAEESRWCDNINFVDVIGDAAIQFGRNFNGELLRFKLLGLAFVPHGMSTLTDRVLTNAWAVGGQFGIFQTTGRVGVLFPEVKLARL